MSRLLGPLAVALAVPACVSIEPSTATWQPAAEVAAPLTVELGPPPPPRAAPTGVLRIASWNVATAADPEALAGQIQQSATIATADIVLVQEIEAYPGEPGTRASRLAGALGMTWVYAPERVQGDGTHGQAILSRFPLTDAAVMELPHANQPINERDRSALRATIQLGDRGVTVVDLHLDTRLGPVDRIRQLDPAVEDLPDQVVVGGDLNTNPWAWVDTTIPLVGTEAIVGQDQAQIIDDYFTQLGFATPIPHDADTHRSPIDMRLDTLCPRAWPVLGADVARDVDGSDHWPVWVDVGLND